MVHVVHSLVPPHRSPQAQIHDSDDQREKQLLSATAACSEIQRALRDCNPCGSVSAGGQGV